MVSARAWLSGMAVATAVTAFVCVRADEPTSLQANQAASIDQQPEGQAIQTSDQSPSEVDLTPADQPKPETTTTSAGEKSVVPKPADTTHEKNNAGPITVSEEGRWGSYSAPGLTMPERGAFGAAAGQAKKLNAIPVMPESGGTVVQILGGLALGAVVVTLMLAARTSRVKRADGQRVRALTVGTRLVLAFGGITIATLALGALSTRAQVQIVRLNREAEMLGHHASNAADVLADAAAVHAALADFFAQESEKSFKNTNDALANMKARMASLAGATLSRTQDATAKEMAAAMSAMEHAAGEAIRTHDERMATFTTQLFPTAVRVSKLLTATEQATQGRVGLGVSRANTQYQQARIALFKHLRTGNVADLDEAMTLGSSAISQLDVAQHAGAAESVRVVIAEAEGAMRFWMDRIERLRELTEDRDAIMSGALAKSMNDLEKRTSELTASLGEDRTALSQRVASTLQRSLWVYSALIAAVVVLAAGSCWMLIGAIGRSMAPVMTTLSRVAKGDLTMAPINSVASDEFGELSRSVDAMVAGVKDVLTEVSTSTQDVSAAATEIAASAEEMSNSVGEVARQAQQAAAAAEQAGGAAKSGGDVVGKTVDSMKQIHSSVETTAKSISELGAKSEEIGRIIEVINDIAEQTNLLALNAAIEAARAGVHGRGFAVVADEVRKLAERTTKATEEVTRSIQAIQEQTHSAVTAMHKGTELVSGGVSFAGEAKANLESIVGGASTVASMIKSITAAGEEAGAGASQSAAAAGQLSAKAEELRVMVGRFRIRG